MKEPISNTRLSDDEIENEIDLLEWKDILDDLRLIVFENEIDSSQEEQVNDSLDDSLTEAQIIWIMKARESLLKFRWKHGFGGYIMSNPNTIIDSLLSEL